jgi:hypothetical protein
MKNSKCPFCGALDIQKKESTGGQLTVFFSPFKYFCPICHSPFDRDSLRQDFRTKIVKIESSITIRSKRITYNLEKRNDDYLFVCDVSTRETKTWHLAISKEKFDEIVSLLIYKNIFDLPIKCQQETFKKRQDTGAWCLEVKLDSGEIFSSYGPNPGPLNATDFIQFIHKEFLTLYV